VPEGHAIHRLARDMSELVGGTALPVAEIGGRTSYSCPRCQVR